MQKIIILPCAGWVECTIKSSFSGMQAGYAIKRNSVLHIIAALSISFDEHKIWLHVATLPPVAQPLRVMCHETSAAHKSDWDQTMSRGIIVKN